MSGKEINDRPAGRNLCCGPGLRWLIWVIFLVGWSTLLLMPDASCVAEPFVPEKAFYSIAKTLHVSAYLGLAVLTGWLLVPQRARWFLLLFMSLHAFCSEGLQRFIPGRTGSITDVGFDHLGLYLGLLVSWRWWRRPE